MMSFLKTLVDEPAPITEEPEENGAFDPLLVEADSDDDAEPAEEQSKLPSVYAIFHNKELLGYKTSYKSAKRVCKRVARDVMMRMISNFPCYLYKWHMRYENNKVNFNLIRDPKISLLCSPTQRYAQVEDVLSVQRVNYIGK
jgi:hypothetical protein